MAIFTLNMRDDFEMGDTHKVPINGALTKVTWRDEDTLVLNGTIERKILGWNEVYFVNSGSFIQFEYEEQQTAEELFATLAQTLRAQGEQFANPAEPDPRDVVTVLRAMEHRRRDYQEALRQLRGE